MFLDSWNSFLYLIADVVTISFKNEAKCFELCFPIHCEADFIEPCLKTAFYIIRSCLCIFVYVSLKAIEYVDKLAEVGKFSSKDEVVMEYGNDILQSLWVFYLLFSYVNIVFQQIFIAKMFSVFLPVALTFCLILCLGL